ncbi:HAD-IIIA family hydrolase [Candidatus Woesearchaeota archaeon]|nr:HAD-IIIA family hydrolase [Candidatus Woesearchaeota archaeon]
MMPKAIFLDRDGTLVFDPGYVHRIEDFKLQENTDKALKKIKGYLLFIVTNQSGIGRGIFSEEDMHKFNKLLIETLAKSGVSIEKIYFCPHKPEDNCKCRKPETMMIKEATKDYSIDIKDSYMIGDDVCDIELSSRVGCKGILVLTGFGKKSLKEARMFSPHYISANLEQACDFIMLQKPDKIIARKDIPSIVRKIRGEGKKIATLNGTFDILHKGHSKIINEARKTADALIVGINSDSSVKGNKGKERPFNSDTKRALMLSVFKDIDYVTIFDEKTPIEMLEIIKPDVHVNGSEYGEECIEAETVRKNGGRICIVKLVPGFSTTDLVKER